MSNYKKLIEENKRDTLKEEKDFSRVIEGTNEILNDKRRVIDLYQNSDIALVEIDEQFKKSTGFNKTDVAFTMLATALQICRWAIIGCINSKVTETINESRMDHNDKRIKDMEKEEIEKYKKKHDPKNSIEGSGKYRNWQSLAFNGVPYDVTRGCDKFGLNGELLVPGSISPHIVMEGKRHRFHTLGHDPVLGWIFGTANIISDTITLDQTYLMQSFNVQMKGGPKIWTGKTSIIKVFTDSYESIREDGRRLAAALFAQAVHLKSDEYTKMGLPVPIIETFAPDFASALYQENYDYLMLTKDIKRVGAQAIIAVIINMVIAYLHELYYDPNMYSNHDLYEVKTRHILSISDTIASTSNMLLVAAAEATAVAMAETDPKAAAELAKKGWEYLDIGGILVTACQLVNDYKFSSMVKKEYLEKEWTKKVVGNEYSFMKQED